MPRQVQRARGYTLLQVLLATVFTSYVLAIVYQNLVTLYVGMTDNANATYSIADARTAIDTMSDHLRNATMNTSTSTGVANSCLSAASANSVTYYTSSAGTSYVTYTLTGSNLTRSVTGGAAVNEAYGLTALSFTYYKAATYETPWQPCTTPSAPTAAELPYVCGIQINATTSYNGVSTQLTTTVRLRNAPIKTSMSGL